MTPLDQLDLSELRVLDGAMATELERRGSDISGPLWSAVVLDEAPERIEAVHASYLDAGADCILTASYQISNQGYREVGRPSVDAATALRKSVQLAEAARAAYSKQSTKRRIWIAASLGAYGAALHNGAEYHGNYTCPFAELVAFHTARLEVLQSTNADFVAFETIPSLDEARAITAALRLYPRIGAWVSFTCADGEHVAHGEDIFECGRLLHDEEQIVAVGVNCTAPILVTSLIGRLRLATGKPIVVYPNSGETWDPQQRCWRGEVDPASFTEQAMQWYEAGAHAVGGCCRTGPDHIRAIRQALDERPCEPFGRQQPAN